MVKAILHFLLTLPFIFGNYHHYKYEDVSAKYLHSLPGYVVALPDEHVGIFGDTEIVCRTVCKILSVEGVPYSGISLYKTTKVDLANCHDGYFLVGKEIPNGSYRISNPTSLAQSVRVYDTEAIYNEEHIQEAHILEPDQTIELTLQDCILYVEQCSVDKV